MTGDPSRENAPGDRVDWGCGAVMTAYMLFVGILFIVALETRGAIRSNTTLLLIYLGITLG